MCDQPRCQDPGSDLSAKGARVLVVRGQGPGSGLSARGSGSWQGPVSQGVRGCCMVFKAWKVDLADSSMVFKAWELILPTIAWFCMVSKGFVAWQLQLRRSI